MSDPLLPLGSTAIARGVFTGRACYESAVRVLGADASSVTSARWPGTAMRGTTHYIESLRTGDRALREKSRQAHLRGDWELADSAWQWTGVVEQVVTGRWFSVARMFGPDGLLQCWYVNFEWPPQWRRDGWDTHDLALDLVIDPDRCWHWKDEDEYAQERRLGLITDAAHKGVLAAREEALSLVEARAGLFAEDAGERWLPDPAWARPTLPPTPPPTLPPTPPSTPPSRQALDLWSFAPLRSLLREWWWGGRLKIFFVSDIHGSVKCFRKLVNAGKFYGAEVLIMGGDLAGKQLIPVIGRGGTASARFNGADFTFETSAEIAEFERRVAELGAYTLRTDPAFVEQLAADQELVEQTLRRLILERTEEWVALAAQRLGGTGIRLLIGLGNDDFAEMIPYLDHGPVAYAPDGLLELGDFNLVSLGWSNTTPWHTNRECTEEVLAQKLTVVHESADPSRTIFNIHVPPYDCGLDLAPRLDDSLQIQLVGGAPDLIPVGSTAVADSIAAYQPLLSLHGHIHEGRGSAKNGRTLVVNPGSEYDQGSLLGALIEVRPGKVKRCQLIAG